MVINLSKVDFGGITGGKSKPEEVFDVQPTTTDQTITPTEGSVFSGGTVRAVTKDIDVNIVSDNIKEGVTILGVAGTLKEEKPEEVFNVQPTTAEQTITPTEGSVFSRGTIHAVTSAIDSNIQPENIKEGIAILGVAGTLKEEKPEEVFNVQPTTAEQTITPTAGSVFSGGTVHAVTSAIDSNIQPENIKQGVSILGVAGTLSSGGGSDVFIVPPEMRFGNSKFTEIPSNFDFREFSNVTDMSYMFESCTSLTTIPLIDTSNVINISRAFYYCNQLTAVPPLNLSSATDVSSLFEGCTSLTTIPSLDTSLASEMGRMFSSCSSLQTVEGIDFSGLTSSLVNLFGWETNMPNLTRFIVNGKINDSISDEYSIKALTAIDYDSVKSILTAAANTDNTNAKELAFNRTMTDQNGELAALVASCTTKGWTISGLTLQ